MKSAARTKKRVAEGMKRSTPYLNAFPYAYKKGLTMNKTYECCLQWCVIVLLLTNNTDCPTQLFQRPSFFFFYFICFKFAKCNDLWWGEWTVIDTQSTTYFELINQWHIFFINLCTFSISLSFPGTIRPLHWSLYTSPLHRLQIPIIRYRFIAA